MQVLRLTPLEDALRGPKSPVNAPKISEPPPSPPYKY